MNDGTPPASLAAFLRDITEATSLRLQTIAEQTKEGFAYWCHEVIDLPLLSSEFLQHPSRASTQFLKVPRPGAEPKMPRPQEDGTISEEEMAKYRLETAQWTQHKAIYDNLFAARTPPESLELVIAFGLLVTQTEKGVIRRHIAVATAEVFLDSGNGSLTVESIDSLDQEINWTPGDIRSKLTETNSGLDDLVLSQNKYEADSAVRMLTQFFGTKGSLITDPNHTASSKEIAIGTLPAILLRKKDTSDLLQTLRDMADDMQNGGYVSDPFRMIADPEFIPSERKAVNDRAVLALPANIEQRSMIDRARTETHMVIQGPPGTGKTHTIANLASVLMAEGRRVLITAENERALAEVQSKLPKSMQLLMLPMLKERGTGALEASVNALNTRASANETPEDREHEIAKKISQLHAVEKRIDEAEKSLIKVSDADREQRNLGGLLAKIGGHQIALSSRRDQLAYVDEFLAGEQRISQMDATTILELLPVVDDAHENLRQFKLPEGLIEPSEFSIWLQEHRGRFAVLGDPFTFDYAHLADSVDDLSQLALRLHDVPAAEWSQISRTSAEYADAATECSNCASAVNHGVTLNSPADRATAVTLLEAYLSLDPERYDDPISDLLSMFEQARLNANAAQITGDLVDHKSSNELTKSCDQALQLLLRDKSGLLENYVLDLRSSKSSEIDLLIEEAKQLLENSRAPIGLPVTESEGAPPPHELLQQATILRDHFQSGGKMKRAIGVPKPVKDAKELIEFVRIDGSEIDSLEEANRAVEYFTHKKAITLIDSWAAQHQIARPNSETHFEWINAIISLPETAANVISALDLIDRLIEFPTGETQFQPTELIRIALATVAGEIVNSLVDFAQCAMGLDSLIRVEGHDINSRSDAEVALASIKATITRERFSKLLPASWLAATNPLDVDDDKLVTNLRLCASAAKIPGAARSFELTPSSVNQIIERAQIDKRREELKLEHERIIGGNLRILRGCEPMSPATSAITEALNSEDTAAYRLAITELEREKMMAEKANRLDKAISRVSDVYPRLIVEIRAGSEDAEYTLQNVDELQDLRDYRNEIEKWQREIGSTEPIHKTLAKLYKQQRNLEEKAASLRCWNNAINRLQSKRELRSSLSALTVAMDKVPKTRSAKTYPTRMRALRNATREAAPAIPCWVMTVDRVTEVLGYPKGEDRFDVVIVDEASQAWFPSMFLYAIADQVIIVGDDLQTSPNQIVTESEIRSIVREHIAGHRLADQVGADLSLYDVAAVMTGPDTMIDHFRCVPEIISLSNRLSYEPKGKTLKPSRVREPGSLDPVVHKIVNGSRTSKSSANPKEVDALVEQVVKCHGSRKYKDKTFGVVVVGTSPNAHLKMLRERLLDTLGPVAMEQRKLEVGTPSQFQGAERNVMFLSMVDAPPPNGRLRKWPHEHTGQNRRNVQKLNVAVSRAMDQLFIFRSFGTSDIAPDDARAIILDPGIDTSPTLESQLEKCDSDFERHVVKALATADPSLTIRTQVDAIGYSIDIVIENAQGHRLAVECDGDRWHTEAKDIRADIYRQRTLEGLGWTFDRFLASEWYADPEARTRQILQRLEGIQPDPDDLESPLVEFEPTNSVFSQVDAHRVTLEKHKGLSAIYEESFDTEESLDEFINLEQYDYADPISIDEFGLFSSNELEADLLEPDWDDPEPKDSVFEDLADFLESEDRKRLDDLDEIFPNEVFDRIVDEIDEVIGERLPKSAEKLVEIVQKSSKKKSAPKPKTVKKPASKKPTSMPAPQAKKVPTLIHEDRAKQTPPASKSQDRPNGNMTRKESNRKLAAAMRKLGINPHGEPWERAKKLLEEGATFDEAAKGCQ